MSNIDKDAEIASLRAQLDEAKALLADVKSYLVPALNLSALSGTDYTAARVTCDQIRALLSESKT